MLSKLAVLPNNGFAPNNKVIADHLREMADWIERGDETEPTPLRNCLMVMETIDGEVIRRACGQPLDRARSIGLLTVAAVRASTETGE